MKLVFALLVFHVCVPVLGQNLSMTKGFGWVRFATDTIDISPRQALEILEINPTAHSQFKKAMVLRNTTGVMGFGGSILMLAPLTTLIIGGKPQWGFVAVGGALVAVAIPIELTQRRHLQSAVDLYNAGDVKSFRIKPKLYLTGTGARLVLRF
jgi:hypothetical protein